MRESVDKRKFCPLFGKCGGCDYVNDNYSEELIRKHLMLEKLLSRYGYVERIIPGRHITHYRCKVHAVCGYDRDGKFTTGIYRKGSHRLIPVRSCILEDGRATAILQTVRQMANKLNIKPYDEDYRDGDLRHILIRLGYHTNEIMVVLVTRARDFPRRKEFVDAIIEKHPDVVTVVNIVNDEKTSMIIPEDAEEEILYGKGYIVDKLNGVKFRISASSFYQINPEQTEILYDIAMKMAQLRETDTVLDAYCGTGTIGLIAAKKGVEKVIGVESNPKAVEDARLNAEMNHIENAEFVCQDAAKYLKAASKNKEKCDVLFLDPPRSGSSEEFLAAAGRMDPDVIVYISCNPETLSRDLRYITRFLPYRVRGIQPVDLFPGTMHVETVVLMSRVKE